MTFSRVFRSQSCQLRATFPASSTVPGVSASALRAMGARSPGAKASAMALPRIVTGPCTRVGDEPRSPWLTWMARSPRSSQSSKSPGRTTPSRGQQ